jgi:quinol monooxygenase YgiN
MTTAVWTHGTWTVKPGQEAAFVMAWSSLARASLGEFGTAPPTILRDRDRPNVYITFGPFGSMQDVDAFRASDLFSEGLRMIRPLLDSFDAATLDEVGWA